MAAEQADEVGWHFAQGDAAQSRLADVNHTVAIWQSLHARFTEHTGLATPPVSLLGTLMRKPKKQVPNYLAALRAEPTTGRPRRSVRGGDSSLLAVSR